jgi:hypothetical protein
MEVDTGDASIDVTEGKGKMIDAVCSSVSCSCVYTGETSFDLTIYISICFKFHFKTVTEYSIYLGIFKSKSIFGYLASVMSTY